MAKRAKLPSKAQMEERAEKLDMIIRHIKHLNPINMFWDQNYIGAGIYEEPEEGGRKILNYHGFNVWARYTGSEMERAVLEYRGKAVLELSFPICYNDKLEDVNVILYKEGVWERAFDNIIQMGFDQALRSYFDPIDKAIERRAKAKQKAEHNKFSREQEQRDLEARAMGLGFEVQNGG